MRPKKQKFLGSQQKNSVSAKYCDWFPVSRFLNERHFHNNNPFNIDILER